MVKTKLTRRGKIVLIVALIALAWFFMNATTPAECKVPVEEMSQFCVDLMFP